MYNKERKAENYINKIRVPKFIEKQLSEHFQCRKMLSKHAMVPCDSLPPTNKCVSTRIHHTNINNFRSLNTNWAIIAQNCKWQKDVKKSKNT